MEERVWHRLYDKAVAPSVDFGDITVSRLLEAKAERSA